MNSTPRHIPSENIGLCDECGIEESSTTKLRRMRVLTNISHGVNIMAGKPTPLWETVSLDLFLCADCRSARQD